MKIFFTTAEYNPFHLGHALHIEQARKKGATHIAAVMSGNFVQRGEPAIFPKNCRAAAAVSGGVDLVFDLPSVWALAPAERFARASITLALSSGVADGFTCGCETANPDLLSRTAKLLSSMETKEKIQENRKNLSYPAAVAHAVPNFAAEILSKPNNILAVEYLKSLQEREAELEFLPIERQFSSHDAQTENGGIASAKLLRSKLRNGEAIWRFLPPRAAEIFENAWKNGDYISDVKNIERQVLAVLRRMSLDDFTRLHGGGGGFAERFYRAVRQANSLDSLLFSVKSKRFTLSGVRRFLWNAVLEIPEEIAGLSPPYLRVLAFNQRGTEILRAMRKRATLPIVMRKSDIDKLDTFAKRVYDLECRATDFYNTFFPSMHPCGTEMTENILKDGV